MQRTGQSPKQILKLLSIWGAFLCLLLPEIAHGANVDLCELKQTPTQFIGKMISVRGTQFHGWEYPDFYDGTCEVSLAILTPQETGQRVKFKLNDNEEWRKYQHFESLNPLHITDPSAKQYKVTATFRGLIVYQKSRANLGTIHTLTMILQEVSDVTVEEQ